MKIYTAFLVTLLIPLESSVTAQWQTATLLEYDTAKFFAAYTENEPNATGVTILDGSGNELVFQFEITTNVNADGYIVCYAEHKVCEVYVTKILQLKTVSASMEISLLTTNMTSNQAVTAEYVGRNLRWPSTVESSESLPNFNDMDQTFGGLEPSLIGWSAVPTKIDVFTDSGNLVGIRVNFSTLNGSTESTQTFGNIVGGQQNEIALTSVEEIKLYYVTSGQGAVCGINIVDSGANNKYGCNTNKVSFPMENNFAFAGFSALQQASGDGAIILYPLQYQLLHPRVVQWEATDEEITFTLNIFWPASRLKYSETLRRTARNADNEVASATEPELVAGINETTPYTGFYSVAVSSPLPCSPVGLVVNTEQTENRMFEDQTPFFAWTYGYQDQTDQSTTIDIDNPTSDGPVFSSRPKYPSMIASDATCENILPVKFNMIGSQLLVNDYALGSSSQSSSSSDVDLEGKFINKVTVHANSSDTLTGLTLMFDNFNLTTVGSDPADGSDTVSYPSSDNLVLWYIEAVYENDKTTKLIFHWAQPREPVLIKGINILDEVTGPVSSTDFTDGVDADMQEIVWYNPVDYSKVKLYLSSASTGAEVNRQTSFLENEQMRGGDGSGVIRNLVASSTYSLYLEGIVDFVPEANADTVSIMSIESENQTFTTPPGADVACGETNGSMNVQIEYEAIPLLSTNFASQTETVLTANNETGLKTQSALTELQPLVWSDNIFFQKDPADAEREFTGYPIGVKAYWLDDDCIRGLALVYKVYGNNQVPVWVAGNEDDFHASSGASKTEEAFHQVFSSVSYELAGSNPDCLSGIQFTSICIGPASNCTSNSTAANNDQRLFSFTAQSSSDGIFGLNFDFASIDLPSLSAIKKSCELSETIDQFWLRSTYWTLDLDLSSNVEQCGTLQELLESQTATGSFIDHNAVYKQKIARTEEETLSGNSDLLDLKNWHVPAYCFYNSEGDVTGKVANVQQNVHTVSNAGEIPFKMEIYTNYRFSTPYHESTPSISMGDPVYVMVSAQTDLSDFEVVSTDCWATKSGNPTDVENYILQSNTCAVDPTFEQDMVDLPLSYAFHFTAFSWLTSGGTPLDASAIYLHCDVRVCPQGEAYCQVTDPSECDVATGSSRRRRSLEHGIAPFGSKQYRLRRKNPIIVVKEEAPKLLHVIREEVTVIQIEQHSGGAAEELLKFMTFLVAVLLLRLFLKKFYFGRRQNPLRKF